MNNLSTRRLKSLADPGRLRVLTLISASNELCVCEIEQILGVTPSTASRSLKELELVGWLRSRRVGRWIYYRLADLDPEWREVRDSILRAVADDPSVRDMLEVRDNVLSPGHRACNSQPESLETLYEQIDQKRS